MTVLRVLYVVFDNQLIDWSIWISWETKYRKTKQANNKQKKVFMFSNGLRVFHCKIKNWPTHTKTFKTLHICKCTHKLTLATLSFLLHYLCLTLLKLHDTWGKRVNTHINWVEVWLSPTLVSKIAHNIHSLHIVHCSMWHSALQTDSISEICTLT